MPRKNHTRFIPSRKCSPTYGLINSDLERIGDLAENVAKRVVLLTDEFRIDEVMLQLQRMVQLALAQLTRVTKAMNVVTLPQR